MKSLEEIRQQLYSEEFQLTRHALKRQTERNIVSVMNYSRKLYGHV